MNEKELEKAKKKFLSRATDAVRLGGYGGTVHVEVVKGVVRLRSSKPKRKQKDLGPDSKPLRAQALRVADAILEKVSGTPRQSPVPAKPARAEDRAGAPLLVYHIWQHRLQNVLPEAPPEALMEWGRKEVAAHFRSLSPNLRAAGLAQDSVCGILDSARRLHRSGALPFEKEYDELEGETLNQYVRNTLAQGKSPHTAKSDVRRFGTAVRAYAQARTKRWGDRKDVTKGVRPISTKHVEPPEVGEEVAQRLIRRLREIDAWRGEASSRIALASGRRVGAISGGRDGLHLENPPLTANDFTETPQGGVEVCWRGTVQKGGAYDRGDVVQPATAGLEEAYRWLVKEHPNPLGPKHPLIWDAKDPRRPAAYDDLRYEFSQAWKAEFGKERPSRLLWHSFCRTTITTLVDEVGASAAAEFTGRSVETVLRIYKRRRQEKQVETARALDQIRNAVRLKVEEG